MSEENVHQFSSPVAQTIEASRDLLSTPVQANVTPILICFLVMVGCLCGILYLQIQNSRDTMAGITDQLKSINMTLVQIDRDIDQIRK